MIKIAAIVLAMLGFGYIGYQVYEQKFQGKYADQQQIGNVHADSFCI